MSLFADGPISHYFLLENPIKSTKVSRNTEVSMNTGYENNVQKSSLLQHTSKDVSFILITKKKMEN